MNNGKIIISGAGLAGSLLASCLANRGFQVEVFERRPDMRKWKAEGGRSINLALSNRGIKALRKVHMDGPVLKEAIPMHGRMMHNTQGVLTYQPYGTEGQFINSVSRSGLNMKLISLAEEKQEVNLHFSHRIADVNFESTTVWVETPEGQMVEHKADAIIAADGAFSPIRLAMQKTNRFNYSQQYENYGYKELEIPPLEGDHPFQMEPNALHIWPRGEFMMIALPNPDGSFTCTLFLPYEGPISFDSLQTEDDVHQFFHTYFADTLPLISRLEQTFFSNPTGSLVTVRCAPWVRGKVALLGDAAHAIVPFYGQGMNCAFEDVAVLDNLIESNMSAGWEDVLDRYQKERIPNANAIADLALQNFIEMRDLVGHKDFLDFKEIEHTLCEKYPHFFKSQYELVTFSDVTYKTALESGEKNASLIRFLQENDNRQYLQQPDQMHSLFSRFHISV